MEAVSEVVLARAPHQTPCAGDFQLVQRRMPSQASTGELLVRVIALSLDPYLGPRLRGRHMGEPAPSPGASLPGQAVAQVLASGHPDIPPGTYVVAETGWRTHAVVPAAAARRIDPAATQGLPLSAHLGMLGMPGLTAWAGVTQLARVAPGDTFSVDAAAGAVGGAAGHIARNLGATVVGIAGGAEKCEIVLRKYGFHACVDRRSPDWAHAFAEAAAPGPTVHFENVGLSVLDQVWPVLRDGARVVVCGLAEHYHEDTRPTFPLGAIVAKRAQLLGLVVYDFERRLAEWVTQATAWASKGMLTFCEDIADGIEKAPMQFERLMRGDNIGKAIVRVAPEAAPCP